MSCAIISDVLESWKQASKKVLLCRVKIRFFYLSVTLNHASDASIVGVGACMSQSKILGWRVTCCWKRSIICFNTDYTH